MLFNVYHLSTDDGPGLRDTFFLKGCHLRCIWCHNPESLSPKPEIWWDERKCIGAMDCVEKCPAAALTTAPEGISIDRERCNGCGLCALACPSKAIEQVGRDWTPEEMLREAVKDKFFFKNSGGGVTVSGGEPALQPRLVSEFFRMCQLEGIHTALDTCGFPPWESLEESLAHADLVLYDIKEMNPDRHREFTGVGNERILSNLLKLRAFKNAKGQPPAIWIRTPVIPRYTATEENIHSIGKFLADNLGDRIERWELCAFNNTCSAKYERLGLRWPLEGEPLIEKKLSEKLLSTAGRALGMPQAVRLTGLS